VGFDTLYQPESVLVPGALSYVREGDLAEDPVVLRHLKTSGTTASSNTALSRLGVPSPTSSPACMLACSRGSTAPLICVMIASEVEDSRKSGHRGPEYEVRSHGDMIAQNLDENIPLQSRRETVRSRLFLPAAFQETIPVRRWDERVSRVPRRSAVVCARGSDVSVHERVGAELDRSRSSSPSSSWPFLISKGASEPRQLPSESLRITSTSIAAGNIGLDCTVAPLPDVVGSHQRCTVRSGPVNSRGRRSAMHDVSGATPGLSNHDLVICMPHGRAPAVWTGDWRSTQ